MDGVRRFTAYADGASLGNPGPASWGVSLVNEGGLEVATASGPLGHATNNVAEWQGAIAAVKLALAHGATHLDLRLDSQLVAYQIKGRYRVKHPGLKPLHTEFKRLAAPFGRRLTVTWIPREENARADQVAGRSMPTRHKPTGWTP